MTKERYYRFPTQDGVIHYAIGYRIIGTNNYIMQHQPSCDMKKVFATPGQTLNDLIFRFRIDLEDTSIMARWTGEKWQAQSEDESTRLLALICANEQAKEETS